MKIEALKQRLAPGSEVAFLIAGGAEIKGRILRFEESLIVIEQTGRERTLFAESITGFEIIPVRSPEPPTPDPTHQPAAAQSSRPTPSTGPVVGEGVGLVELPTEPPRPAERPIHNGEGAGRDVGTPAYDDATLTWARALEHVDSIRKALVAPDRPCEQALVAAQAFANEFIQAPAWIHRDSNIRYLLIQAFKAVEHQQRLRDAGSPEALLLSQTLLAINRALRQPAGIRDEERFTDLYHVNVAVRTHLVHYRKDEAIWKEFGDSLREAHAIGTKVLNEPNFATLWEREPYRRKTFFYRLSEVCRALVTCAFSSESETERLLQRANEYSLLAGGQPLLPAPTTNAMGAIVTFGAKQFGFIQTKDQRDLFFTLNDVLSATLRAKLTESRDQLGIEVDFDEEPQATRRCDRAVRIRQPGFILGKLKRLPRIPRPEFGFLDLADGREAHFQFSALPDPALMPQVGESFLCHVVRNPKGWTVDRADTLVSGEGNELPALPNGGPAAARTTFGGRTTRPNHTSPGSSADPETSVRTTGRITWFDRRGFGFIQSQEGKEIYFHINEVSDADLRRSLDGPNGALQTEVNFEERPAFGQKYNRAADIRLIPPREQTQDQAHRNLSPETDPQGSPAAAQQSPIRPSTRDRIGFIQLPGRPGHAKPRGKPSSGRIVSFGKQGFGFIEARDGTTLFFRLEDVQNDMLRQELLTSNHALGMEVNFEQEASPGHRYDRAVQVSPTLSEEDTLVQASELERAKDLMGALRLVRRVLEETPDNPEARIMRDRLLRQVSHRTPLAKGAGPFARAERAWTEEQNLDEAERLYRVAIDSDDRLEQAVKRLASLLEQRDRRDEAIALLERYQSIGRHPGAFDQALSTSYEHAGQFDKALGLLTRFEQFAEPSKRVATLRRIARAYFKLKRYQEAERKLQEVLRLRPDDHIATKWLASLEQAREDGSYEEADELLAGAGDVVDLTSGLTGLAEAMVDQCQFDGVEPSRLSSGQFTLDDVSRLEKLADQLGTQRPRDRAAYYLSAAAILRKVQPEEESQQFADFLQRYFISMGDAARLEQQHLDVVRTYYAESLALSQGPTPAASRALGKFLRSYASPDLDRQLSAERLDRNASGKILQRQISEIVATHIDTISKELLRTAGTATALFAGLLNLTIRSRAALLLLRHSLADKAVVAAIATYLDCPGEVQYRAAIEAALDKKRMTRADELRILETRCAALTQLRLTTASMEDLDSRLEQLNKEILCDLDSQRLSALRQVAIDALAFSQAADFEEHERHYFSVRMGADRLRKEIEESPTHVSFQSFLRVVEHVSSLVEESYAELARTSVPDLKLRLEVETYIPDSNGDVGLQIGLTNRIGCSPASGLELQLGPPSSPYFWTSATSIPVTGALRGGADTIVMVPVKIQDRASSEGAFPITLIPRFQNRLGQKTSSAETQFTVRLYDESKFTPIQPNPYAPWSEGGAVDNPDMFFGREELLCRVRDAVLASGGTKSVVIYGQKRAGKSTVLEHLKRKLLSARAVPVAFSLQDISTGLTEAAFLYRILQGIRDTIRSEALRSQWNISIEIPTLKDFAASPALMFHEQMSQILHDCRPHAATGSLRLVLLIDEFTDIFTQIQRRTISRDFMKLWKAIIEKRYFSCVLVGKDIMRAFMAEFPNELGVIEAERLTYLPEPFARELIEKPLGRDCYRGKAIARILELTACSPYYAMMFCDRFVDYMNHTRSLYVTDADVERVKAAMLSGPDSLTQWRFDPLYNPGEGAIDTGLDPDETFAVCTALAKGSVNGWCLKSTVADVAGKRDQILHDLESREVLDRKGDSYRIRVGLFREWLLANAVTH